MKKLIHLINKISIKQLTVLTVIAFVLNRLALLWLNTNYAASQFPVPFFEGQLAFSSDKIESYYQHMINIGTLEIYIRTQMIDFLFLTTVIFLHTLAAAMVYKLVKGKSFCQAAKGKTPKAGPTFMENVAVFNIVIAPFAGIFDAIENLFSFLMLQTPDQISDVIAKLYSSSAAIKFGIFSITYLWLGVAILFLVCYNIIKQVYRNRNVENMMGNRA